MSCNIWTITRRNSVFGCRSEIGDRTVKPLEIDQYRDHTSDHASPWHTFATLNYTSAAGWRNKWQNFTHECTRHRSFSIGQSMAASSPQQGDRTLVCQPKSNDILMSEVKFIISVENLFIAFQPPSSSPSQRREAESAVKNARGGASTNDFHVEMRSNYSFQCSRDWLFRNRRAGGRSIKANFPQRRKAVLGK